MVVFVGIRRRQYHRATRHEQAWTVMLDAWWWRLSAALAQASSVSVSSVPLRTGICIPSPRLHGSPPAYRLRLPPPSRCVMLPHTDTTTTPHVTRPSRCHIKRVWADTSDMTTRSARRATRAGRVHATHIIPLPRTGANMLSRCAAFTSLPAAAALLVPRAHYAHACDACQNHLTPRTHHRRHRARCIALIRVTPERLRRPSGL